MKIGLVTRQDKTGLGVQTQRLTRLLSPDRLMIIDSTKFKGTQQYPEWYKDYNSTTIKGFPLPMDIRKFLVGLDVVITCETFYNPQFVRIAKDMGVKTVLVFNYEFCDNLKFPKLEVPDVMVSPSYWHLDEMKRLYNAVYIPTPIFKDEYAKARRANKKVNKKPHFLFMNGTTAVHDRNGLESLYEALKLSYGDCTVTIKAQSDIRKIDDPRVIYDFSNPDEQHKLYSGYDAMILPRRYGGQSLPMTEALSSGLPVFMPDCEPNNKILPDQWLIKCTKTDEFMARVPVDLYTTDAQDLADILDSYIPTKSDKDLALKIAEEFSEKAVRKQFNELLETL